MSGSEPKGDSELPETALGPPVPPGEQGMLEPPREEGALLPLQPEDGSILKPRLNVSHSVLAKGATSAGEIHTAFYEAAASLETPTGTAATEFEGWTAAQGLRKSHEQWEIQAGNVAAWLARIEQSLRDARRAYRTQDHGAKTDLEKLLKQQGQQDVPSCGPADPAPPPVAPRRSAIDEYDR
ncbi:hypothetical protein AN217_10625 [Streptomyces qinglanensis]|uniref:Uncharacterized protein n=1 Tax=Streptomyces qinglanensis TaxID=943816 RepID=A0A1E7K2P9_9ACTN|nr:hypothetical protein [Streptomyces qinglanensis]OEU98202.1 hypothetical protein AN217_10625 [Streptomyces qinglanensis]OEV26014.1 hypothetical protein AN220_10430 [Streptomyces nanshensis]